VTAAVDVKKYYIHMVGSVVTSDGGDRFVLDVESYEDDLQNMLTVSRMLRDDVVLGHCDDASSHQWPIKGFAKGMAG